MSGQAIIQIMCPSLTCRRILAVPLATRGKLVRCRSCGSTIRVPESRVEVEKSDKSDESTSDPKAV